MAVVGAPREDTFTPRYRTIEQFIQKRLAKRYPAERYAHEVDFVVKC